MVRTNGQITVSPSLPNPQSLYVWGLLFKENPRELNNRGNDEVLNNKIFINYPQYETMYIFGYLGRFTAILSHLLIYISN